VQHNHALENKELFDSAALGASIDEFWDSRIGQYLLERVLAEYNSALEKLKTCDPTNLVTIIRLQSDVKRAESFREWLSVAIANGLKSLNILKGLDDEAPE
jgi:hypothetical protein